MFATWAFARTAGSVNKLPIKIMSIENESIPAPKSPEAIEALAQLEKEGHNIETGKPDSNDGEIKDTKVIPPKEEDKVEDKPKEEDKDELKDEPKDSPKDEKKPDRTPTMVPAWKLKVAEDQKQAFEKKVTDLETKIEEMSKQKAPVTKTQSEEIKAEIAELAKGKEGIDVEFLSEFADRILSKTNKSNSSEVEKTVKELKDASQLQKELNEFSGEFEKDVAPLVADMKLSSEALSKLKESLKGYAFSDVYAKVPLKEIFAIKQSELVQTPKKSSEGKASIKVRASDVIDIDNISEDDFAKLPPEKVEEFMTKRTSSDWKKK